MNIFKKTVLFYTFIISPCLYSSAITDSETAPLLGENPRAVVMNAADFSVLQEGFELCGRYNLQQFLDQKVEEFHRQHHQEILGNKENNAGEYVFDTLTHAIIPAQDLIVSKLSQDKILAGKFCRMLKHIIDNNLDLYTDSIRSYFYRTTPHHITDKFFQYCVHVDFMQPVLQKYILDDVVRMNCNEDYKTRRSKHTNMTESQFNIKIMSADLATIYSGEYSFYKKIVRNDNVQILHFFMHKNLIFSSQVMFNAATKFDAKKICCFLRDYPFGGNCLHLAITMTSYDKMPALISSGCNIDQKDNKGNSPLHLLVKKLNEQESNSYINYVKKSQQKAVSLLISSGANLSQENNEGKTPWDCAANEEIRDLLKPQAAVQPTQFSVTRFVSLLRAPSTVDKED